MIIRTCDQFFNLGLLTSDCETRVLVVLLHIENVCEELLYVRCCCQASMHKYGATILNLKQPHGRLKFLDPLSFYTPTPPLSLFTSLASRAVDFFPAWQMSSFQEPLRISHLIAR